MWNLNAFHTCTSYVFFTSFLLILKVFSLASISPTHRHLSFIACFISIREALIYSYFFLFLCHVLPSAYSFYFGLSLCFSFFIYYSLYFLACCYTDTHYKLLLGILLYCLIALRSSKKPCEQSNSDKAQLYLPYWFKVNL